jgi:5-methylthioadenosine/S-adenosylhomocysteine deaminase
VRPTLVSASWLLPVTAPPLREGALLVDAQGRIAWLGPAPDAPAPDDVLRLDLPGCALLPGLVNVHTHPELTGFRGLLEDLPFQQWIPTLRRTRLAAQLDADELLDAALWSCAESLAAGVTCTGATEDSDAAIRAFASCGMRGVAYREVFGPDPAHASAACLELQLRVDAMRVCTSDLVRVGVSPHAPYTVSDALYAAVAGYARKEGLPVAVHAAEAEAEALLVERGQGPFAGGLRTRGIATPARARSPIELLERTGILEHAPLVIHAVRIDAPDIALLESAGASIAHCPVANARLGHGTAPIVEAQARGVNVALGTDSVASNNRIDLLEEARCAQLLQRARLQSASVLAPAVLLRMATLHGARALGFGDRAGALAPGLDADLCAVRLDSVHARPVHDPIAALFLAARGTDVVLTAVRGRVLYQDGKWTTLDVPALTNRLEGLSEKLRDARSRS